MTAPYRFTDWGGHRTAIICGTGPSLTPAVVARVNRIALARKAYVFGVNNTILSGLALDGFFANNVEWWDHYGNTPALQDRVALGTQAWTWDQMTAINYGVNYVPGRWSDGPGARRRVRSLSTDPAFIHYGHGSGYEVLGCAYHCGVRRMLLVGYDLRYPTDGPRHFFGEYPKGLQHWPKTGPDGQMTGLLDIYETIDLRALGLEIVNCTPGSALTRFGYQNLEEAAG
jgi:hypothetical protein